VPKKHQCGSCYARILSPCCPELIRCKQKTEHYMLFIKRVDFQPISSELHHFLCIFWVLFVYVLAACSCCFMYL
jgi:hypothetical protein